MKINEVYEGWKNHLLPERKLISTIEKVSGERMEICGNCEYNSLKHSTNRPDEHCTKCGCTLVAKTKCLSCECPIGKWKQHKIEENGK